MSESRGAAPIDSRISDSFASREVVGHEQQYHGRIWDVVSETFRLSADNPALITRDFIDHPGAVAVVALDDERRVLMLRQYRHPVRGTLWEIPAGLLDVPDEAPQRAAARELAEETDMAASRWHVLSDVFPSAGSSTEAIRIFLATDISAVPEEQRTEREDEESEIVTEWVPLEEAVAAVLAGQIHSMTAVAGILATQTSLSGGVPLRPADAPWPAHPRYA